MGIRRASGAVALLLLVTGCGARGDDAGALTAEIVDGINAGSCDDGPDWLATTDWTTLCAGVRHELAPGGRLMAGPTTTRQSGEIGYSYASDVSFTDTAGSSRRLLLQYAGRGWSGARPELSYASLDGVVVLFDGGSRSS